MASRSSRGCFTTEEVIDFFGEEEETYESEVEEVFFPGSDQEFEEEIEDMLVGIYICT